MRELPTAHRGLVPRAILSSTIGIVGCGHLGSNIAVDLRKLGFYAFALYDDDRVEERNLGGSAFNQADVGGPKVTQLKQRIVYIHRNDESYVVTHRIRVTQENVQKLHPCEFYFLVTDDAPSRFTVARHLIENDPTRGLWKDSPWIIDGRTRAEWGEILICPTRDTARAKDYLQNLMELCDDPTPPLPCNQSNVIQTTRMVTAIMTQLVCEVLNGAGNEGITPELKSYHYVVNSAGYLMQALPHY